MANILITHHCGVFYNNKFRAISLYEGLINSFCSAGHNVAHIITNDFLYSPWNGSNTPRSKFLKYEILKKIKKFSPDLIISFNNSSIEGIEKEFSCPIALWNADYFEFFNDKKFILNNQDRFYYLSTTRSGVADYKKYLFCENHSRIFRVPNASGCVSTEEEKKYNISFIGNPFFNGACVLNFFFDRPEYIDIVKDTKEFSRKIEEIDITSLYGNIEPILKYSNTGFKRAQIVYSLLDLSIKIFGPKEWLKLGFMSPKIFNSYDKRAVFSLQHNEKIYNRSYVSLNINHTQTPTGCSWRVYDIMASSSVLLSDYRADLESDFPEIKLPMYNSNAEAFTLAKQLLNDSKWREDIVLQSNNAINERFRWHHRFPLISQITGVDLISKKKRGLYKRIEVKNNNSLISGMLSNIFCGLISLNSFYSNTGLFRKYFPKILRLIANEQMKRDVLNIKEYN
ncbi:MAG: glycosyltransferase [Rickettsiales bacterium]|nr:glycosyltransferase [Rickettsiales bacterium]